MVKSLALDTIIQGMELANTKSAKKSIRQTSKRTIANRFYKTRIKNLIKAVRQAVEDRNFEVANSAFKKANRYIHKYVNKSVIKKNTASRRISRLNILLNSLKKS